MLAVDIASTTAKPSVTLPRNRKVGSLGDSDRGQTRFDNPTLNPRLVSENQQDRGREPPDQMPKTRAEWIKGRKFVAGPLSRAAAPWLRPPLTVRDGARAPPHHEVHTP